MREILAHFQVDVNETDEGGVTLLHKAAAGAGTDVKQQNGTELLHNAASHGANETIKCLLSFGAEVVAAGGYENLVRTYRRVLTAPHGCLTRYLRRRFGRDAPHDIAARVLEFWKPPGGP
ncbi:hypothetical protein SO694_0038105 [Aureococcus anophagefferens]|uniref:Ankyrin repeat protein n=1 Tax=Aureococcus anophagefferens TaxID=44056 RepID=A0ABR1G8Q5_AURAN